MKKNVVRVLALVLVALMCLSLVPLAAHAQEHVHNYEPTRFEPTCSEDGYIQMYCEACGDGGQILEYIPPTGLHSFMNVEDPEYLIHEGDCEHAWQYWKSCSVCQQSAEEAYGKALDEMYEELNNRKNMGEEQDWETLIKNRVLLLDEKYKFSIGGEGHHYIHVDRQEATCTSDGWKEYSYCDVCGEYFNYEAIPAKGHRWGEFTQTKAPTCTEDGSRERVCEVCEVKEVEAIPALGHSWGEFTQTKAPTCTEDGAQERVCSVCGEKDVQVIPALGHRFGPFTVTKPATCTVDGEQEHVCTVCGFKETEAIPAAHKWGAFVVTEEPSCYASGTQERTCSVCGEKQREFIPAAHKFGEFVVTMEPTCYSSGEKRSTCSVCGETHVEWIDKVDHKFENGECVFCHIAMPAGYVAPSVETIETETTEPVTTENQTTENQTTEPQTTENQNTENQTTETVNEIPENAIYISFDGNGATGGSMADQAFAPGAVQALKLNAFTREGYEFLGWDVAADGSAMGEERFLDGESVELNADVTLYAQWKQLPSFSTANTPLLSSGFNTEGGPMLGAALEYKVTLDPNNGESTVENTQSKGSPVYAPVCTFTAPANQTFNYWEATWTDTESHLQTITVAEGAKVVDSLDFDLTLTAIWKNGYTITFNKDEANATGSMDVMHVSAGDDVKLTKNGFALKNHKFIGWSTTSGGAVKYDDEATINPSENMTLHAVWERTHYTISFDKNNDAATGTMGPQTAPRDGSITLTTNAFNLTDKTFIGWSTNKNVDAVTYQDGATIQMKDLGEDITLYAIWRDPVKITFYSHNPNGSNETRTQIIGNGEPTALIANPFTISGMTFKNWSIQPDDSGTKYQDKETVTLYGDTSLYAQWVSNECRIVFDANGGTRTMEDQLVPLNVDTHLNPNQFIHTNPAGDIDKVFLGWNEEKNPVDPSTNIADKALFKATQNVTTLYAQWGDAHYIHFKGNGNTNDVVMDDQMVTPSSDPDAKVMLNANEYIRKNSTFLGWNTDPNPADPSTNIADRTEILVSSIPAGGLTLYAQWDPYMYSLRYQPNNGTGTMEDQEAPLDRPLKVKDNGFTAPADYMFGVWNTEENGGGTNYMPGDTFTPTSGTKFQDTTLFAQWRVKKHIFFYNNGYVNYKEQIVPEEIVPDEIGNKLIPFTETGFSTPTGKKFIGWSTTNGGTTEADVVYADQAAIPFDAPNPLTLYAVFKQVDYTVTFKPGDAPGTDRTQTITDGEDNVLMANPFTYDKFEFVEWKDQDGKTYEDEAHITEVTKALTLTAQWKQVIFEVTFQPGTGASGYMAKQRIKNGEATPLNENAFSWYKHQFKEWSGDDSKTYTDGQTITEITADLTLTAQWYELATVTFVANNGLTDEPKTQTEIKNNPEHEALTTLEELGFKSPANKVFRCWNTVQNPTTENPGTSYGDGTTSYPFDTDGARLYAQWDPIVVTIKLEPGKEGVRVGGGMADLFVNAGDTIKLTKFDTTKIQRERYSFTGWNTKEDGTGDAYADEATIPVKVTEDAGKTASKTITLYAQWKQTTFTINYAPNGGSINQTPFDPEARMAPSELDKNTQTELTLRSNEYSRVVEGHSGSHYTFMGWNTKEDGTGTHYDDEAVIPAEDITKDMTLYAQWATVISFNKNNPEVTGTMEPQSVKLGEDAQINKLAFDSPYWTFNKWNTAADGSGRSYANQGTIPAAELDNPLTLYAQWVMTSYAVRYEKGIGGGSPMAEDVVEKGKAGTVKECGYTAPDLSHVFGGWLNSADGKLYQPGDSIETTLDGQGNPKHVTLTAQWMPKITITFDPGTGTGATQTQIVPGGVEMNLKTLTELGYTAREDFEFECWTVEGDTKTYTDGGAVTLNADTKLIAKWKQITFTVTFKPGAAPGTDKTQKITDGKDNVLMANPFTYDKFEFTGWKDQDGKTYTDEEHITEVTKDLTLTAQWKQVIFEVTFQPGTGATGYMGKQRIKNGEATPLNENAFTWANHRFKEWSGSDSKTYTDGQTITEITADLTLTAQWYELATVTFIPNNGLTDEPKTQTEIKGNPEHEALNTLAELGFKSPANKVFNGWNTLQNPTPENPGIWYGDGTTNYPFDTDGARLYAQWDPIVVTIKLEPGKEGVDKDGGMADLFVNAGDTIKLTKFDPTKIERNHYSFTGWNTKEDGTGDAYADEATIPVKVTEDAGKTASKTITLYAQWKQTTFTINYAPNGGSINQTPFDPEARMAPSELDKNTQTELTLRPNEYSRVVEGHSGSHYTFMGWNTEEDGSGTHYDDEAVIPAEKITKDMTLYAQWATVIVFDKNDVEATGTMEPQPITIGEETNLNPNEFKRTNWTFSDWNELKEPSATTPGVSYADKGAITVNDELTLYAQWLKTSYAVNYHPNEGGGTMTPSNISKNTSGIVKANEYTAPSASKIFVEWNTKANGTGKSYAPGEKIETVNEENPRYPGDAERSIPKDIDLYAIWAEKLSVWFYPGTDEAGNEAGGTTQPVEIPQGVEYGMPTADSLKFTPPSSEETFAEWKIVQTVGGEVKTTYALPGDLVTFTPDAGTEVKVYGTWTEAISITYNANGGTLKRKSDGKDGGSLLATAPKDTPYKLYTQEYLSLSRKGYEFLGWALGAGAETPKEYHDETHPERDWKKENEPIVVTEGFSQDTTIYAVWNQLAFIGEVVITGSVTDTFTDGYVGETLTADVTKDTKFLGPYDYQWLRDGVEIDNATAQTYVVSSEDYGCRITCRVKAPGADPDTKFSVNYKDITIEDTYKEIDIIDNVPDDDEDYLYGLTDDMYYSFNSTDPAARISVKDSLITKNGVKAFPFFKQGTYRFYYVKKGGDKTQGSLIATVVVRNWYSLDYEITNRVTATTTTSKTSSGSGSSGSGSSTSGTSTTTGTGTVQMKNGSTVLSASSNIKDKSGNTIIKGNGTNAWLVREGANTDLKITVRPASNSYGFVYFNGSQIFSTSSEVTKSIEPISGPEHYHIVFVNSQSSPKTADTSNLGLWSALGFVSFVGLASILVSGRKRRNRG